MNHINHIDRYVTKYVHQQLTPKQRRAVMNHVRLCEPCRAVLDHALKLAHETADQMPLVGRPSDAQLDRLFPLIIAEARTLRPGLTQFPAQQFKVNLSPLSQYGVALVLLIVMSVFISATIFHSPASALEVPFQLQPSDIQATWTPVVTDPPHNAEKVADPSASLTAVALMMQGVISPTLPVGASPAPIAK